MAKKPEVKEPQKEVVGAGKTGGMLKWILLFVFLSLVIAAISGGAVFYLMGGMANFGKNVSEVAPKPMIYYSLEPLTANITSKYQVRFLRTNIAVASRDEKVIVAIEKHLPVIRNNLLAHLAEQDFDQVNSPAGKEQLREELQEIVASVLVRAGEPAAIEKILFNDLVMQ